MSNMLRAYRRNILREYLRKNGKKHLNKKYKAKKETAARSVFARVFSDWNKKRKAA